jgi:hypothetical protein
MSSSPRGRWVGWIRLCLLLVVGMGSVLAYIALAVTINGQPMAYQAFPGWVALLQPATESYGDNAQLRIRYFGPDLPALEYTVAACGHHAYRGELLIGGDAQLAGISSDAGVGPAEVMYPVSLKSMPSLIMSVTARTPTGVASSIGGNLGPVQIVSFRISQPPPCPTHLSSNFPTSAIVSVDGNPTAPLEQSWIAPFGLWHGPHLSAAWPLAGAIPDAGGHRRGKYQTTIL